MKIAKIFKFFVVGAFVLLMALPTNAETPKVVSSFSDVKSFDVDYKAVNYLREEAIVQGYGDGTYRSGQKINRAEFLKIVMEASDYVAQGSDCYSDVADEWFAKYVCKATELGLVEGYSDGRFRPDQDINFAEASKIVLNTLGIATSKEGKNWFDKFVLVLEDKKAIPVTVTGFDQKVTRGEMAEMIWRIKENRTYRASNSYTNVATGVAIDERAQALDVFDSCVELEGYLSDNTRNEIYMFDDMVMTGEAESADSASEAPTASAVKAGGGGGDADFSTTNTQVDGVDEADIVKTDGKYIYLLKNSSVRIVEAYPTSAMKEVKKINFAESDFYPEDMYVDGDRLVVIGYSYEKLVGNYWSNSVVYIYDIGDPKNPDLMRKVAFEGSYVTSRKIGNTVYFVGNKSQSWSYLDNFKEEDLVPRFSDNGDLEVVSSCGQVRYVPGVIDTSQYLIVAAIDVENDDSKIDREVIMGSSGEVFVSNKNLYVAEPRYPYYAWYDESGSTEETFIHKFNLSRSDINYEGMGRVPGTVLNQFSMDENNGNFRVATTLGSTWSETNPSTNNLYVLDQNLKLVGKVENLARGEKIYSVRFMGDKAYMVTFKETDPLFVIGLSDPKNPTVLGELKIPGYSQYLHPYGEDYLIGIGKDAVPSVTGASWFRGDFAWYQGMKIALFDVRDVNSPKLVDDLIIGERGTTSEVLYNHKAFLFDDARGFMALPISISELTAEQRASGEESAYGQTVWQGAYVYDIDKENGFTLRGKASHHPENEDYTKLWETNGWEKDIKRILYIGDYFYTTSEAKVLASDMAKVEDVKSIDLAK